MIRFIILAVVAYVAYRALKNWMFPRAPDTNRVNRSPAGEIDDVMIKDPYCGTYFPSRDGVQHTQNGKELVFCSQDCKQKYIEQHSTDQDH